ncbi:MAG: ABC transporter ATP-binding protein/permease [Candidatus Azambacteria bacterium]|nr:ABC transporter ATP-binding protein/permease [Candidatus Azambacteria bacterium]
MKQEQNISARAVFAAFWRGVKPYKLAFFGSVFCFSIGMIVNVFIPILYKEFFDILNVSVDRITATPSLVRIVIYVGLLHGLSFVFYRGSLFIYNTASSKIMARLRQNAFNYMVLHSYSFFASNFTGSLVQRVNRFSRSFERIADTISFNVIPLIIAVIGAIAVTLVVAPPIALIIACWVVIFVPFHIFFARWKQKYDILVATADSKTTGVLADSITNQNAITLFTGYQYEKELFEAVTEDQAKKARFSWNLGGVVEMMQMILVYAVEFIVFYFAIFYWQREEITIGVFVLAQAYIIGLSQQLWSISRVMRDVYEGMADSREMVEILSLPYEVNDVPNAGTLAVSAGAIAFKNVSFNFNETRTVLHDIAINIHGGEKIALVGPSGAGKTTFVRLILRLYDPVSGAVQIDGQDIKTVTQESLRTHVSLVPQDPVLFHRTLMENIRYGRRDATDAEVMRAATLAHCDEFIEELPQKYETFVGERGIKLSGGERQRVAIARAILKNAPILILDEATSSLDSHSESLIQDALDTLMHSRTTIVIAHRLSTIRKMDRIIVMEHGKIHEEGTHDELIKKEGGLYEKLWKLQVSGFIHEEMEGE